MRRLGSALVICLLVTAGVATAQGQDAPITVGNGEDDDCDGKYAAFDLSVALVFDDSADLFSESDPYVVVEYATDDGYRELTTFDDVSPGGLDRGMAVTASDLGGLNGRTHFRAVVFDADLLDDDRLLEVRSPTVGVEPRSEDASTLEPTFEWSPAEPRRSEPVTLTATRRSDDGCAIESWRWDLDGDGSAERRGRTITHTFDRDGTHTVELTVVDERNETASVARDLLVVFDPDGDGVTSAVERERGTDPTDPDTDGDLFDDGIDPLPGSVLVPTGLLHGGLAAAVYAGVFRAVP